MKRLWLWLKAWWIKDEPPDAPLSQLDEWDRNG